MRRGGARHGRGERQPYQRQGDKTDQRRPTSLQSDALSPISSPETVRAPITIKSDKRKPIENLQSNPGSPKRDQRKPMDLQSNPGSPTPSAEGVDPTTIATEPEERKPTILQSNPASPKPSAEDITPATAVIKPEERKPMKLQSDPVSSISSAERIVPTTIVIKPEQRKTMNPESSHGSPMLSAEGIAPATTTNKSDLSKAVDLRSDPGTPKPSAEDVVPATAATAAMHGHPAEAVDVSESRGVDYVKSATASPFRVGSDSTAEQAPQEQQQEEKNRGSIPPKTPSLALQHANQLMAATGGMQIQVAAAQPKDKPLAAEKRRVKRQRLVKPKTGSKENSPGAPPRLFGSTPTSIPDGPDDVNARIAPDDRPAKLGAPSPLPSPMRSTAGESEAQPGSGAASPTCTSYDVTTPASVDSPPMVPSPSKSATTRGKQNDDKVDVRDKASSPRSPQKAAAELLVSYEKLYDMIQSRSQETVTTRPALTRSGTRTSLAKSIVPRKSASVMIAVTLGVCAILLFGTLFLLGRRRSAIHLKLCRTEDCQRHATLLTKHLNTTLDPCDDFEAFVCSAWQISKKYREQAKSVIDDLRFTWYQRFEDTLTSGGLKYSAGRKPLAMYLMCNLYFPSNASQIELIHEFFAFHGFRWPEPPEVLQPPLALLVLLSYYWASPYWITVHLLSPSASGRQRVIITPGLYVSILRNQHQSVAVAYGRYWQMFLELLYPNPETRPPMNGEAVEEIRAMEKDVLDTLHAAAFSLRKRPATFPFREIGNHVPNASAVEWVEDFQSGMALRPSLTVDDEIVASDVAYLEVVSRLLDKYGPFKLNQHLVWLILQNYAPVTDYAFLVGYYGSNQKTAAYRPSYCAHKVEASYKVLVLALGVVARLTVLDRRVIDAGFKSLVSAASGRIRNSAWMDDEDKVRMITKFASVSMDFLPTEAVLDDGALEGLYEEFPENRPSFASYWIGSLAAMGRMNRTPEYRKALLLPGNNFPDYANYGYISNTVQLAIGAAAAPAYYSSGTEAMLYGGLLFLLAMQMAKAVDEEGIRWYTNQTALDNTFLSNASLQAFRDRSECRYAAGNESAFPEVPALEIAYAALKESHLQRNTEPLALSEQLPEDKVFFMTLCYMSCGNVRLRGDIAPDCNKAVRNSDAFARVYACAKGSKMNPEKKCSFFA